MKDVMLPTRLTCSLHYRSDSQASQGADPDNFPPRSRLFLAVPRDINATDLEVRCLLGPQAALCSVT